MEGGARRDSAGGRHNVSPFTAILQDAAPAVACVVLALGWASQWDCGWPPGHPALRNRLPRVRAPLGAPPLPGDLTPRSFSPSSSNSSEPRSDMIPPQSGSRLPPEPF